MWTSEEKQESWIKATFFGNYDWALWMVGYFREECVPLQMSVGRATACVVKRQGSSFSRSLNLGAITILLSLSKKIVIIFQNSLYLLSIYEYQTTPKVLAWNNRHSCTHLCCFWVLSTFKGLSLEIFSAGSFLDLKSRSHLGMKSLKDSHAGNLLPKISHVSIGRAVSPLLVESLHSAQAPYPKTLA